MLSVNSHLKSVGRENVLTVTYHWTSNTDSADTESEELQCIGSISDTTISVDLDLLEESWIDLVDLKSDLKG